MERGERFLTLFLVKHYCFGISVFRYFGISVFRCFGISVLADVVILVHIVFSVDVPESRTHYCPVEPVCSVHCSPSRKWNKSLGHLLVLAPVPVSGEW